VQPSPFLRFVLFTIAVAECETGLLCIGTKAKARDSGRLLLLLV
jgi:hypothetical protein